MKNVLVFDSYITYSNNKEDVKPTTYLRKEVVKEKLQNSYSKS